MGKAVSDRTSLAGSGQWYLVFPVGSAGRIDSVGPAGSNYLMI